MIDSIKYLGVWIDYKLNWSAHIHALSLQLTKYCSVLYRMRDFIFGYTLNMHCYCFVYSHVIYDVTIGARLTKAKSIRLKLKRKALLEQLLGMKLNDLYKLELAKFVHRIYNKLPIVFLNLFTKTEKVHTNVTRRANKLNCFLSIVNKTAGRNQ